MAAKDNQKEKDEDNLKQVNVHEGRLRKILQFLKEKEATITVDYDLTGQPTTTTYGEADDVDHSLKKLIQSICPRIPDWAFYEYQKKDFTIRKKHTVKKYHHHAHEKPIIGIICTFLVSPGVKRQKEKEGLFFSGVRKEATNLHAVFPGFRNDVRNEIHQFQQLLNNDEIGFPYQSLRNYTAHRCHRHKLLEKEIFQYLKDCSPSTLDDVKSKLSKVVGAYTKHLDTLEEKGVGHEIPHKGNVVKDSLSFYELSYAREITVSQDEEKKLEEIGFQTAFSATKEWFNDLHYKKIKYWRDTLSKLSISAWPEYFLEHILLAYLELNIVCAKIVECRNMLYNEVGYYIKYSKVENEVITVEKKESHNELAEKLSSYEYLANAFVDSLRSDGNLLKEPLRRLPESFKEIASPDRLFYSRIEKLLWEYLLFRLCDSCELDKEHVLDFYTPLYKPVG